VTSKAKKHKKPVPKKKPQPVSTAHYPRSLTDIKLFFRNINWAEWWEDWYTSLNEHGGYRYQKLRDFIRARAKSEEQRRFLFWYLGEEDEQDSHERSVYPFATCPQDWLRRRAQSGYLSETNLIKFGAEIRRRMGALAALKEVGDRVILNSLARAEKMAQQLDEEMGGRLFLPQLSAEGNAARAQLYLGLHGKLLNHKKQAQDMYARAHGVNFDDMAGLMSLMQASVISSTPDRQDPRQRALQAMSDLMVEKATRLKLPLPEDAEAIIVDASEVVEQKKKFN
jgi:hypothetical protein